MQRPLDPEQGPGSAPRASFRVTTAELAELDRVAAERGLKRSVVIRTAIAEGLRVLKEAPAAS